MLGTIKELDVCQSIAWGDTIIKIFPGLSGEKIWEQYDQHEDYKGHGGMCIS